MLPETFTFSISILVYGAIILLLIYYILTLADVECNCLGAVECCARMNFWVIPKFGCHLILGFLLLLDCHWLMLSLNAPMIAWLAYELWRQPKDSLGVYDPFDMMSLGMMKVYLRNTMIFLGYYFMVFFIALYYLLISLLKGDPIRRHEEEDIVTEL